MRILVCGGRDFSDRPLFERAMGPYRSKVRAIIHGCAAGADTMAADWASDHCVDTLHFRADWNVLGRAAGPLRNQRMIEEGKPDLVVAFPGGRGTADMVRRARAAGVSVEEIPAR